MRRPASPKAVVLVLHGGDGDGVDPVRLWQPAVARTLPLAAHIACHVSNVAVLSVINPTRGLGPNPTANLDLALERVAMKFPEIPIVLVGHSLGGSVALAGAWRNEVHAVIALAPWLSGTEMPQFPGDTPILLIHGSEDRVTDPRLSRKFVSHALQGRAEVSLITVQRGTHAMLRRWSVFHGLCSAFIRAVLHSHQRTESRTELVASKALTTFGIYTV